MPPDIQRVLSLPRRTDDPPELRRRLSEWLRVRTYNDAGEENMLLPAQPPALREFYETGCLFMNGRVGCGKTLITFTAPILLQAQRPLLVIPASDDEKTRRDFARYSKDWHVRMPRILHYEEISLYTRERELWDMQPDVIMFDEAAAGLGNPKSGRAKRIARYILQFRPKIAVLSGTLIGPKFMGYWHLLIWALKDRAPAPFQKERAIEWAPYIDRGEVAALGLGAVGDWHAWLRSSRGVFCTTESDCDAEIRLSIWNPPTPPEIQRVIDDVADTKIRPDGEPLGDLEVPDVLCQLAQRFFYVWDPLPPSWWRVPRSGWFKYERYVLDLELPAFDTPAQLALAIDRHRMGHRTELPPHHEDGAKLLDAWREVEPKFTPNPVPIWLDESFMDQVIDRAGDGCLIWTRHRAVGEALARRGVPWYGGGIDPERAPPGQTIGVSIQAHTTSKNLQAWHKGLWLVPMGQEDKWEQGIGRMHRRGQKSPVIYVDILCNTEYHETVLERVFKDARKVQHDSGFSHKLLEAKYYQR